MSEQKYDIVIAADDAAKVGYSVGVFATKFFYQVSGIEGLKNSMDSYMISRFSQRLEYFIHEHEKLTDEEKKDFYDELSSNKQNVNYLYEFIEKARTTTYDIHAKLLARLSVELIKNRGLNYYESNLLSNINQLNDIDLIKFYNELKGKDLISSKINIFNIDNYQDYCIFNKFVQLGFFEYKVKAPVQMPTSSSSPEILYELPGMGSFQRNESSGPKMIHLERAVTNKKFKSNEFTNKIFKILDEIMIE
jgi:hypothetical protein